MTKAAAAADTKPAGSSEKFVPGQIAPQPFPDQRVRESASAQHPRKRDVNRDWKRVPRGSLATD